MRADEFFRRLDSGDVTHFMELFTEDCQGIDGGTAAWLRDRRALEAYLRDSLPSLTNLRTEIVGGQTERYGEIEVETATIRQSYSVSGTAQGEEAAATIVWRRIGDDWRVVVAHIR